MPNAFANPNLADAVLIEEAFAPGGTAQARDAVVAVPLALELVIVCKFFVYKNSQYLASDRINGVMFKETHSERYPGARR